MALARNKKESPVDKQESTQDTSQVVDADTQVAKRASDEIIAEVMRRADTFDEDALRSIKDFDQAIALVHQAHGPIESASDELGDGFAILSDEDKRRLVGVPLLFMEWDFYDGDFGSKFVAIRVVARNPDGGVSKYIVNDGSTGVCEMLARYQVKTGKTGGLLCHKGFRASDYTYCEACGEVVNPQYDAVHAKNHKKATTFYIDTSA